MAIVEAVLCTAMSILSEIFLFLIVLFVSHVQFLNRLESVPRQSIPLSLLGDQSASVAVLAQVFAHCMQRPALSISRRAWRSSVAVMMITGSGPF